jgi:hypothetical protein
MNFEFDVEFVFSAHKTRVVVGTIATPSVKNWAIGLDSTIGGVPIECLTFPPRALTKDGKPRLDLVAFQLTTKDHLSLFKAGERVAVENLVVAPSPNEVA